MNQHNIFDFKSLQDIIEFQKSFLSIRQTIISQHEYLIKKELNDLRMDLKNMDEFIIQQKFMIQKELNGEINQWKQKINFVTNFGSNNLLIRLINIFKLRYYNRQIQYCKNNFDIRVNESIKEQTDLRQQKNNRYHFIHSNFEEAVKQSYEQPSSELERKKRLIDEVSSYIVGAIGELRVVNELKRLSDEYYLINDFSISFTKAIYNRHENDYIRSIQIDHILVSPSGVFLIETKNWGEDSLKNSSLRSPVQQIRRTSFVLFKLLNNDITNYQLHLDKHQWGDKKIPIKNLVVLTHLKPNEEFQYVKILSLNELLGYVKYFKPIFSSIETQRITDYLLNLNNVKLIDTNRH